MNKKNTNNITNQLEEVLNECCITSIEEVETVGSNFNDKFCLINYIKEI